MVVTHVRSIYDGRLSATCQINDNNIIVGFTLTVVMIVGDFSVDSQPIVIKFYKHYFLVMWRLCPEKIIEK